MRQSEELARPGSRDVAQPEPADERVDLPIRLGPRVADMEVGAEAVSDKPLASALERGLGGVIEGELAL